MPINDYPEKEIRNKIINKINPKIKTGRGKHAKGNICIGDKVVAKVKIPNDHNRIMKQSKSKYIAHSLCLDEDEFNSLIDCPMKGPTYYEILKEALNEK